jgi:hypothetical protein
MIYAHFIQIMILDTYHASVTCSVVEPVITPLPAEDGRTVAKISNDGVKSPHLEFEEVT